MKYSADQVVDYVLGEGHHDPIFLEWDEYSRTWAVYFCEQPVNRFERFVAAVEFIATLPDHWDRTQFRFRLISINGPLASDGPGDLAVQLRDRGMIHADVPAFVGWLSTLVARISMLKFPPPPSLRASWGNHARV